MFYFLKKIVAMVRYCPTSWIFPKYLATKAEMMKINFSQTLTEALEQKLAAAGN